MSDYPLPEIVVSGGRAGHYAITHDLELAARLLQEASDALRFAGGQMDLAHGFALDAAPAAINEVRPSVLDAQHAVHATRFGSGGFHAIAAEFAAVSSNLTEVAHAYERAEAAAYQGVSHLTRLGRVMSDMVGLSVWSHRSTLAAAMKWTPADWSLRSSGRQGFSGALSPDGFPGITGLLSGEMAAGLAGYLDTPGTAFGSTYATVLWLLARATSRLESWFGEWNYAGVVPVIGRETLPQPHGVADLVVSIDDTAQLEHGGITIDTIEHPDGTRSHIINIPGTDDTTMSDESVRDWNSNFRATGNYPSDAAAMVRDAIEAAGIDPDDPIMFQGHSQGGIVASQLAVDLADDYTITHVVTYGSAPDRIPVLDNVEYLNVVTAQDPTPGGDGKFPPDLPNVTTVELDLKAAPDPQLVKLGATIPQAHSLAAYHAAAQAVDASDHLSLEEWKEGTSGFLGGGEMSRQQFKPTFEEPQSTSPPAVNSAFGQTCGSPAPRPGALVVPPRPTIDVPSGGGASQLHP